MTDSQIPDPAQRDPDDAQLASRKLAYTSIPVLATALVLSMVLLAGSLYVWYALGPDIRAQVTLAQAGTLLFFVVVMIGIMMAVGYSRLWAGDGEVVVRNGPFIRHYPVSQIAGLRLRKGDPWAYLLVKDPEFEGGIRRRAVLAIQSMEREGAGKKVRELRRWLKANGATSADVPRDVT